jgi:diamine N-acetyltransferase
MLKIQQIQANDATDLSALANAIYFDHYSHFWNDSGLWYVANSFSIKQLSDEMLDLRNLFYFAKFENDRIGFLKLRPYNQLSETAGDGFEIERIYLHKKATGKGIGRKLMEFAIEMAIAQNKDYVWLKAMDSSHDAIRFYESLGFGICGTSRLDYERLKPELRGMVAMKKELKIS